MNIEESPEYKGMQWIDNSEDDLRSDSSDHNVHSDHHRIMGSIDFNVVRCVTMKRIKCRANLVREIGEDNDDDDDDDLFIFEEDPMTILCNVGLKTG